MGKTSLLSALSRRDALKLFGVTGLGVGAVAACGRNPNSGTEGGGGMGGTLSYRIWSNSQLPVMEDLTSRFMAKHPDVDITTEVTPDPPYFQQLEAAGTTGTLPDVFWMHGRQFLLYASSGLLTPIDDVIESAGIDLSAYPQQLLDLYTYDGAHYAIPRNNNSIGLWYNKALFDAAGVPYPDESWGWDNLRDAAMELTNSAAGQYGFASTLTNQTSYWNAIYQNNGSVISEDRTRSGYDQPETIEAMEWWTSFIRDGSSPTYQQMSETEPFSLFQSGRIAMIFDGDWQASTLMQDEQLAEQVDVAVLPQGRRRAVILHGSGNVVAMNSKNQDTAAELVGYLGGEEAQTIQSEAGASGPPAYTGAVDSWTSSSPTFNLAAFTQQIPDGVIFPHSYNTEAWLRLEGEYLADAWAGTVPIEEAASNLAREMNSILEREQG